MSQQLKDQLLLHLTVLIYGFTGILGKAITVQGDVLVFYRTAIASVALLLMLAFRKNTPHISNRQKLVAMGVGLVVACHWITFFQSIKLSNVSITLACLSLTTLLVAVLEPLFFKSKFSWLEVGVGILIIGGLGLILNVELNYLTGMLVGFASSFLAALFTLLNKKLTPHYDGMQLSLYEMLGGFLGIGLYFVATQETRILEPLPYTDWIWLIILGTICTAFAFWATLLVLKRLSAYAVVLAINMEPVYGFILGAWIFNENEVLSPLFYVGAGIIVAAIFVYSYLKAQNPKQV